jgi:hypothetical protein
VINVCFEEVRPATNRVSSAMLPISVCIAETAWPGYGSRSFGSGVPGCSFPGRPMTLRSSRAACSKGQLAARGGGTSPAGRLSHLDWAAGSGCTVCAQECPGVGNPAPTEMPGAHMSAVQRSKKASTWDAPRHV